MPGPVRRSDPVDQRRHPRRRARGRPLDLQAVRGARSRRGPRDGGRGSRDERARVRGGQARRSARHLLLRHEPHLPGPGRGLPDRTGRVGALAGHEGRLRPPDRRPLGRRALLPRAHDLRRRQPAQPGAGGRDGAAVGPGFPQRGGWRQPFLEGRGAGERRDHHRTRGQLPHPHLGLPRRGCGPGGQLPERHVPLRDGRGRCALRAPVAHGAPAGAAGTGLRDVGRGPGGAV